MRGGPKSLRCSARGASRTASVETKFTQPELSAAEWLRISAWHHGYPQPDDDAGYLELTYDLSRWCRRCGIGKEQKAPFRMRSEPKWGVHGMLQLIWVYDELFARPDVCSTVFEPFDVESARVLDARGEELQTVRQIVLRDEVDVEVDVAHNCEECGRGKYPPVARGFFSPVRARPRSSIARSAQYFGSGSQADRALLVSQAVVTALRDRKVRGFHLQPCVLSAKGKG